LAQLTELITAPSFTYPPTARHAHTRLRLTLVGRRPKRCLASIPRSLNQNHRWASKTGLYGGVT